MFLESNGRIKISLLKNPNTSEYGGYEGTWDADAGITHDEVVSEIKKKIGKPVKWVATFNSMGHEENKIKTFKGRGKWTAK